MSVMDAAGHNDLLREVLRETGWTHDAAARAVNRVAAEQREVLRTNKSSITHWIGGTRPNPRTLGYLTEALARRLGRPVRAVEIGYGDPDDSLDALPADPVDALGRLGRADVDRRQMLTGAVYSLGALLLPLDRSERADRVQRAGAGAIGWSEVEAVTDITAAFNRADERLGGGFGRTAVVEYLATDVATYCHASAAQPVRQAMFGAAAQLAYLCGWKAHDIGREALAQRYYLHAYQLATESGDTGQAAYVMRILAHQAYDLGHHTYCVDLATVAVDATRDRVDRHTQALFQLTLAKAHAMRAERRQALAAVTAAETLMGTARDGDDRPAWAAVHGVSASQFHNHTAKVLVDLGDLAGAEEHFSRSIDHCLDPVTQPRIYALAQTWLAEVQCRQGRIEQACHTWTDAFSRVNGIQSNRTAEARTTMAQLLAPYCYRGIPAVQRLLHMS